MFLRSSFCKLFPLLLICTVANGQIGFGNQGRGRPQGSNGVGPPPGSNGRGPPGGNRVPDIIFDDAPVTTSPDCVTPSQKTGHCKPLAQCAIFYAEIPQLLDNPCSISPSQLGICCPLSENEIFQARPLPKGVGTDGVLQPPVPPNVPIPRISPQQLNEAAAEGIQRFEDQKKSTNAIIFNEGVQVQPGSAAESHQRLLQSSNQVQNTGEAATLGVLTSKTITEKFRLSPLQGTFALPRFSARNTPVANSCPPTSTCIENYPYRTIDGSCNNRNNPDWGKSSTAFQRIVAPVYDDGVTSPRTQGRSGRLPSPRLISSSFIPDENRPYNNFTLMLMQWGQFLDHDLTFTPIVRGANSTGISCCRNGRPLEANLLHPDCFPINIPGNDGFYSRFRQQCMEFVRSLPAPRRECNFGPREQLNQITAYLDGSNVYGSTDDRSKTLREFVGGRLAIQRAGGPRGLLPANRGECSDGGQKFCFRAGDTRCNEQPNLAVLHTIWVREHNRIADILQSLNPTWPDETIYQETRRIVIAEMQHITYNEFLPLIIGPKFMQTYDMSPHEGGPTRLYNPETDATITNEFATAAYRFGHTLVQGVIKGFSKFGREDKVKRLEKAQFAPFDLYDGFDSLVRGLTTQESQQFDNFVSESLTNHLFEGGGAFGLDLMALNIQRGRDHGIPPFNDVREVCGFERASTWDQLAAIMNPSAVRILSQLYASPDDIDLFVGGIGEIPLEGAVLGPTFVCIVGDQFARLRRGDRFFYEEVTARFTTAQLNEIRKVSLARVLCDNADNIEKIQPLVFQQASFLNKREACNSPTIQGIDFNLWRASDRGPQQPGPNPRPQPQPQPPRQPPDQGDFTFSG